MRAVVILLVSVLILGGCAGSTSSGKSAEADTNNPLYSLNLMRQGSLLLQQGRYESALEKFEKASAVAPGNATPLNMMGLCYHRMAEYDQALIAFNEALAIAPTFTDAKNNRGATYLAMGQYRMAEVEFVAALSDPTYPHRFEVYYNLGMTYLKRGQTLAAKENFRKALDENQPVFEAYLRLAEIQEQEDSLESAVSLLKEAVRDFPSRAQGELALGRALIRLGRGAEAEPHLRKVINDDPDSPFAEEARQLLGEH